MSQLMNGQAFPHLEFAKVGGGSLILPESLAGRFGVILMYRGSWCPYCNAQLSAFQRAMDTLGALKIFRSSPFRLTMSWLREEQSKNIISLSR